MLAMENYFQSEIAALNNYVLRADVFNEHVICALAQIKKRAGATHPQNQIAPRKCGGLTLRVNAVFHRACDVI